MQACKAFALEFRGGNHRLGSRIDPGALFVLETQMQVRASAATRRPHAANALTGSHLGAHLDSANRKVHVPAFGTVPVANGNLVSADYKDYAGQLDKYAVESMSENRDYIDTIDYNEDLKALFDELEEAEEN